MSELTNSEQEVAELILESLNLEDITPSDMTANSELDWAFPDPRVFDPGANWKTSSRYMAKSEFP